jgi:hypothetical protein
VLSAQKNQRAVVFFDCMGIVHHEYAPQRHTVTQHLYLEVFTCLHDSVCCKWPQKLELVEWQIHHGSTSAAMAVLAIPQDTAPCDFLQLSKLKKFLKSKIFEEKTIEHNAVLLQLPVQKFQFMQCFWNLPLWLVSCEHFVCVCPL